MSAAAPKGWTAAELETIRALWAEGKSASEIARAVPGRSRNSVLGRLHRDGLTGGCRPGLRSPAEQRAAMWKRRATIEARREPILPPKPVRAEPPRDPIYEPKISAREVLPGSDPVAEIIGTTGCKWPVGGYPHQWCNEPVRSGAPYCMRHCALAYSVPEKRRPEQIGDVAARVVMRLRQRMDAAR